MKGIGKVVDARSLTLRKQVLFAFGIVLAVTIGISGCSQSGQKDEFVQQVLKALYAGSAESIKDKCYSFGSINEKMADFGPKTKQRYGAVKSVEHAGILKEQYGIKQEAWMVTCERGTFRLQVMTTKEGQMMSIWVDPAGK